MASGTTKLIKRRIKSAKNIAQITKAMQMVAASKMKRAQNLAVQSKPFAEKIYQATSRLAERTDSSKHRLLKRHETIKKALAVVITTNKGLCGSLNTNLLRALDKWKNNKGFKLDFATVGKKGQSYAASSEGGLLADFSDQVPFADNIPALVKLATRAFLKNRYQEIWLVYNDFVNALKQKPKFRKILPIEEIKKEEVLQEKFEYLLEPSAKEILNSLLPFYLETQVRDAILEAEASEHSARMIAMKNATENANVLMDNLTLEYNKLRQQSITSEIADIATAKTTMGNT